MVQHCAKLEQYVLDMTERLLAGLAFGGAEVVVGIVRPPSLKGSQQIPSLADVEGRSMLEDWCA